MFRENSAVLYIGLVSTLIVQSLATTNVQSFSGANCDPGTSTLVYTSELDATADTECKTTPDGTQAVWVESLSTGPGCTGMLPESFLHSIY
jgi:hypothetical protein